MKGQNKRAHCFAGRARITRKLHYPPCPFSLVIIILQLSDPLSSFSEINYHLPDLRWIQFNPGNHRNKSSHGYPHLPFPSTGVNRTPSALFLLRFTLVTRPETHRTQFRRRGGGIQIISPTQCHSLCRGIVVDLSDSSHFFSHQCHHPHQQTPQQVLADEIFSTRPRIKTPIRIIGGVHSPWGPSVVLPLPLLEIIHRHPRPLCVSLPIHCLNTPSEWVTRDWLTWIVGDWYSNRDGATRRATERPSGDTVNNVMPAQEETVERGSLCGTVQEGKLWWIWGGEGNDVFHSTNRKTRKLLIITNLTPQLNCNCWNVDLILENNKCGWIDSLMANRGNFLFINWINFIWSKAGPNGPNFRIKWDQVNDSVWFPHPLS